MDQIVEHYGEPEEPEGDAAPRYYLGEYQTDVLAQYGYAPPSSFPGWVKHMDIVRMLNLDAFCSKLALQRFGPYSWATEFENIHALWSGFQEPGFNYEGIHFNGPEQLYQLQKVGPPGSPEFAKHAQEFASATDHDAYFKFGQKCQMTMDWPERKDAAMLLALRCKFTQSPHLRDLLLQTKDRPLVSIKVDDYWGTGMDVRGLNRLGQLLQQVRDEIREEAGEEEFV